MKAAVHTEFGSPDVLRMEEVEAPRPAKNEILVRVRATPVKYGDIIARNFGNVTPGEFNMPLLFWLGARVAFGIRKPKIRILGADFSGTVAAVGERVTRFQVGDEVFGTRGPAFGALAESLCIQERARVALKPVNMTHEEAATLPYGAMTALNLLRKVGLRRGERILILGASGGIGSAAVQLARHHFGAEVVGVCSGPRVEMVRALGAQAVLDYTREDFTRGGEKYDVILDVLGRSSFARCKGALTPEGRYLRASFKLRELLQMLWTRLTGGKRVVCALSLETTEDLQRIKELAETGTFQAVIDRRFPLEQAAEAHRYYESGERRGEVVIVVGQDDGAQAPLPAAAS